MTSKHISLGSVSSRADFYLALSPFFDDRRVPNADALSDLLREYGVTKVSVDSWDVPLDEALILFSVFRDAGISLQLPH